jgi:hypothetical protein
MIDVDIIAATVEPSIPVDHLPPRSRNPDPDDLDRLSASLDDLLVYCCEPGPDQVGDHVTFEPMGDDKQLRGGAVRTAGEQL